MALEVLIIDDDIVSQFATRYCINQYKNIDLRIRDSYSAEDALLLYKNLINNNNKLPDIILLDLSMDKMSGWEFIDHLIILVKNQLKPKVFVLSTFNIKEHRERAKNHELIHG